MTNNFLNFIVVDENNEPVLNEQGLPQLLQRPATKTRQDIERLIALNKPVEVINKFAELVSLGEQWDWAQSYYDYLVNLNSVKEYNANLPDPIANKDGTITTINPKPLPIEPQCLVVKTVEEVLAPYAMTLFRLDRKSQIANAKVTISTGKTFDADEMSIIRLGNAVIKAIKLNNDAIIEWSTDDVPTGIMVDCTKAEIIEAHDKATDMFKYMWRIPKS
ncbi:hypothetical protein [Pseudoalteromonas fuliginea]|uniref:hypothetical protein n=1 Tax=Pseudoalteromonas fuliginea TaxID=1872678 RepID=UPI00316C64B3